MLYQLGKANSFYRLQSLSHCPQKPYHFQEALHQISYRMKGLSIHHFLRQLLQSQING